MPRPRRIGGDSVAVAPPHMDGAVVRLEVSDGPWAEDIPPVPLGFTVTVSFASDSVGDEHRDALELLGYRVVDEATGGDASLAGTADFLVGEALIQQHPTYWRSLARKASRTYALAFGPAAAVVGDIVAAHARRRGV